jgi:hypothetical protein
MYNVIMHKRQWFRQDWGRILIVYLIWQGLVLLAAVGFTRDTILPFTPSYSRPQLIADSLLPPWLSHWAGFDGVHYITIVESGYFGTGGIQAFFPLYPALIWLLHQTGLPIILSGLIIAWVCTYFFLLLWWQELQARYGRRVAWWGLVIILILPGSFFLGAMYTESLFLVLLLAWWRTYQRGQYPLMTVIGIALTATRIVGVVAVAALVLDLLIQAWHNKAWSANLWHRLTWISLSSLGLLGYMAYLAWCFGDPLYFATVQSSFGAGRDASHLILLPQVLWRYAKMFYYGLPLSLKTYAIVLELGVSLAYLGGLIMTGWQNWRARGQIYPWYAWWFAVGAYLLPTLTGSFSSMPRYSLVCLVIAVALARWSAQNPRWGLLFACLSGLMMMFNALLFLQGFWLA